MKRAMVKKEIEYSGRYSSGDRRTKNYEKELVTTEMMISDLEEPRTNYRDKQVKS